MYGLDVIPESQADAPQNAGDFPVMRDAPAAENTAEAVSVRVAVRCRPLLPRERAEKAKPCVHVDEVARAVLVGHAGSEKVRTFPFDHTYGALSSAGQDRIYQECVQSLVESVLDGYNGTVFAYGQTGSGKTFTMGSGESQLALPDEDLGIVPRALRQLCQGIRTETAVAEGAPGAEHFAMRAQLLEIYNEEVRDLLADSPDDSSKRIAIREGPEGSIVVAGATEAHVRSYEEAMRLFEAATLSRSTGETRMNERSSRSHAIFSLMVERRVPPRDPREAGRVLVGKLHLVDLAGSERNKKTQATGARFKEAISINQGLLALGNVIASLADDRKRGRTQHVPYRDSKLTRMLQDSLGGNSRTCMIACISPADSSMDETLNTLKYASRARTIKNRPQINAQVMGDLEDVYAAPMPAADREHMRREIGGLQLELLKRMLQDPARNPPPPELYDALGTEAAAMIVDAIKGAGRGAAGEEPSIMNPDISAILRGSGSAAPSREAQIARLAADLEDARRQADDLSLQLQRATSDRSTAQTRLDRIQTALAKALLLLEELEGAGLLPSEASLRLREALEVVRRGGAQPGSGLAQSLGILPRPGSRLSGTAFTPRRGEPATDAVLLTQRLQTLEGQLAEAQDDLARDEVIFAEKTREIKALRGHLLQLQGAHEGHVAELEAKIHLLQQQLRNADANGGGGGGGMARGSEDLGRSSSGLHPPLVPSSLPEDEDEVVVATEESMMAFGDSAAAAATVLHVPRRTPVRPAPLPAPSSQDVAQLQDEFENLLQEKQELEARAAQDRHDFLRFQHQMQRQLDDLSSNIQAKEDLIQQMAENEAAARDLSMQYEAKLREMERELQGREREKEDLKKELESLEDDRAKSLEEKKRIRQQCEDKVARINAQLLQLRSKIKEQEALSADHEKAKGQRRATDLETELAKLRQNKDTLQKKMREAADLHEKEAERRQRELLALRKDQEGSARRIRELEEEGRKKDRVLRKREEDLSAAQRRVRELEAEVYAGGVKPKGGTPAAAAAPPSAPGSRLTTPSRGSRGGDRSDEAEGSDGGTAPATRGAPPGSTTAPRTAARTATSAGAARHRKTQPVDPEWIQTHVQALVRRHELEARLSALTQKTRGLEVDREALLEQKSRLDLRRIRAAEAMRAELEDIHQALRDLQEEALGMSQAAESFLDARAATEVTELDAQSRHLGTRREELAAALAAELFLTDDEEFQMRRVEDALDSLEAELEFIASERDECQRHIGAAAKAERDLEARVKDLSPADTAALLKRYVGAIAEVREAERQQGDRVCELEVQLSELAKQLEEARAQARRVELEADRRATDLQLKHEKRISQVMGQVDLVARASRVNASALSYLDASAAPSHAPSARTSTTAVVAAASPGPAALSRSLATDLSAPDLEKLVHFYQEKADILSRDNVYYKSVSRDLKRKIRDAIKSEQAKDQSLTEMSRRSSVAASLSRSGLPPPAPALAAPRSAAASHVSLPRDQLRPLTPEQLTALRSANGAPVAGTRPSTGPPESEVGAEASVLQRLLESVEASALDTTAGAGAGLLPNVSPIPKGPGFEFTAGGGHMHAHRSPMGTSRPGTGQRQAQGVGRESDGGGGGNIVMVNNPFPGGFAVGESGVVEMKSPEK